MHAASSAPQFGGSLPSPTEWSRQHSRIDSTVILCCLSNLSSKHSWYERYDLGESPPHAASSRATKHSARMRGRYYEVAPESPPDAGGVSSPPTATFVGSRCSRPCLRSR